MSDPKITSITPAAAQPSAGEEQSHSTRSGQETADYSPIIQSASLDVGSSSDSSVWTISNRYQIREPLGTGGFGTVSLAFDQLIQREVALKRPGPRLSESALGSFLREAQLAAKVRHPGIVTVHDVGVDSSGAPFIVYEYLAGANLKSRLQGKPWPIDEAVTLAIALAEALAAAHREGLTHRDLKPANILFDAHGKPLIADFGLAIEESGQEHLRGQIAGTYKYMSPEQLRGDSHLLDGRTDLWSLGVILYELLTGKHPFPAQGSDELIQQILTRDVRPPRQWNEAIPKPLEAVVLKLLSRDAKERYSSAADIFEELLNSLKHEAGATHTSTTPSERLVPYQSQYWLSAFSSLVAVGLAVCAMSVVAWVVLIQGIDLSNSREPTTSDVGEVTQPLTDADFPRDRWKSLLNPKRGPGEIYFPAGARRNWIGQGGLLVESRTPTFLELGETSADSYSLELHLTPSGRLGNAGFFVGYGPMPDQPDLAIATLISTSEQSTGKVSLTATRIELRRGGEQFPVSLVHAPVGNYQVELGNGESFQILAEIRKGEISQLYLNHNPVDAPAHLSSRNFPCKGKFGLFTFGGSCNFESCRILITPTEN